MPQTNPPPITPEAARAVLALMRSIGDDTKAHRRLDGQPDVSLYTRECWAALVGALSFYAEQDVADLAPIRMARAAVRRAS